MPLRHPAHHRVEDHLVPAAGAVDVNGVAERILTLELAHAHDRGDAAARGQEQGAVGQPVGQRELALDLAEEDLGPGWTLELNTGDMRPPLACLTVMPMTPPGWSGSVVIE